MTPPARPIDSDLAPRTAGASKETILEPFSDLHRYWEEEDETTSISFVKTSVQCAGERDRGVLVRLDAAAAGRPLAVTQAACKLGRHANADYRVDDDGISRFHAKLFSAHGANWIEDLGSRNGTYVNGERVKLRALVDGDTIQLGARIAFRYSQVDAAQERAMHQLYESSIRDPLTGAYNKSYFEERLASEFSYARRHRTHLSLVLLDVDHFKVVNDRFGHQVGDLVLLRLSETVQRMLRSEDVFSRFGGEEFLVLLRGIDHQNAVQVAERIRDVLAQPPEDGGTTPSITVSAGVASLTCVDSASAGALIGAADRRLYLAKRRGRNQVVARD
ncbi:MAG: GGDEF domain-containing protein [Polyangiaceae bacterium]|nr:GGDEF domain-containing protein [Polyangiaceae bacterium]MCB9609074.1 GGDEF domain-containing protein [Polyangiaceae bacterium]